MSISVFSGIGLDGDGDGKADPNNNIDLLYTVATRLSPYGHAADDFSIGLWSYYQNTRAVQRVMQYAKLYETFGKLDLFDHAFPLPVQSDYSYRSTFGMGRNWGGRRVHEGTDLFAHYGVPVRSTCYGVVEIKGWNKYGGWRIGIRDLNNHYHYYAHLQGFDKGISLGDVVTPGQTLGWVGSSGTENPNPRQIPSSSPLRHLPGYRTHRVGIRSLPAAEALGNRRKTSQEKDALLSLAQGAFFRSMTSTAQLIQSHGPTRVQTQVGIPNNRLIPNLTPNA